MGVDLPLQVAQLRQMCVGCPRLLDPVLIEELVNTLSQETTNVPLWEVVLFFVLSAITYYRKQLSCNRVYKEVEEGWAGEHKGASPPSSPPPEPLIPLLVPTEIEPPHIALEKAFKGIPSNLHAKLKSVQIKILRAMAGLEEGDLAFLSDLEGEEEEEEEEEGAENVVKKGREEVGQVKEGDRLTCLPHDALLQVARFLQPQEVLSLGQASHALSEVCEGEAVWRSQWLSRFGSLWDNPLTQEILQLRHVHLNSQQLQMKGWKAFHFLFEQCWVDWLIAGYNSEEHCLVGLHGDVYDLTTFLNVHPGSKETILVNAGSDATSFFEDVGHSNQARALMRDFIVLTPNPATIRCTLQRVSTSCLSKQKSLETSLCQAIADGLPLPPTPLLTCPQCPSASLPLLPVTCTPCVGGRHVGVCHAVCDVLRQKEFSIHAHGNECEANGAWYGWFSCCNASVQLNGC